MHGRRAAGGPWTPTRKDPACLGGSAALTGRASKTIARQLRRHGLAEIAPRRASWVSKDDQLRPGEEDRAEKWGRELAARLPATAPAR